jgi:hypothetical protein
MERTKKPTSDDISRVHCSSSLRALLVAVVEEDKAHDASGQVRIYAMFFPNSLRLKKSEAQRIREEMYRRRRGWSKDSRTAPASDKSKIRVLPYRKEPRKAGIAERAGLLGSV